MHAFSSMTGQPLPRGTSDPWDNLESCWVLDGGQAVIAVRMARGWRVYLHPDRWGAGIQVTANELWEPAARPVQAWASIHAIRAWLALGGRP